MAPPTLQLAMVATLVAAACKAIVVENLPEPKNLMYTDFIVEHNEDLCHNPGDFAHPASTCWFYRCVDRFNTGFYWTHFFRCAPGTAYDSAKNTCIAAGPWQCQGCNSNKGSYDVSKTVFFFPQATLPNYATKFITIAGDSSLSVYKQTAPHVPTITIPYAVSYGTLITSTFTTSIRHIQCSNATKGHLVSYLPVTATIHNITFGGGAYLARTLNSDFTALGDPIEFDSMSISATSSTFTTPINNLINLINQEALMASPTTTDAHVSTVVIIPNNNYVNRGLNNDKLTAIKNKQYGGFKVQSEEDSFLLPTPAIEPTSQLPSTTLHALSNALYASEIECKDNLKHPQTKEIHRRTCRYVALCNYDGNIKEISPICEEYYECHLEGTKMVAIHKHCDTGLYFNYQVELCIPLPTDQC